MKRSPAFSAPRPASHAPLELEQLESLRRLDTCAVSNAIDTFGVRLRNEGYIDSTIRSHLPQLGSVVGYAVTLKVRCAALPPTGQARLDRTDWWDEVASAPGPKIAVLEDVDLPPGAGAFLGEIHARILHRLGCVGAVTNGAVRDLPALAKIPFPVFAGSVAVSHAYAHIVEIGGVVKMGGLEIRQGDLLHGDQHGVLSIPLPVAARIPAAAAGLAEKKRKLIALCRSHSVSLEELKRAVQF